MAGIRHFGALLVGLSGWSYPEWKGSFYAGVPPRLWLARIAERFPAVEVNIGYYRWLRRSAIEGWIKQTPPAFRFAAKGPRTVTHVRRLKNVADVVAQQREIYGAHVRVEFLAKIRDEEKYPDLESLKAQIARDCAAAREILESH